MSQSRHLLVYLGVLLGVLIWSAIRPHDYLTWFLEVLPLFLAVGLLAITYPRFKLTTLIYFLVMIHGIILIVGGHYTYAEMPLFDWFKHQFHLQRDDYDRVGHFAQGFVPALITRELLLRISPLKRGKLLAFLVVSVCLAFSALYELFEWQAAVILGSSADAFLGTQGDPWDTQKDMATCLVGSMVSLVVMSRLHDKFLAKEFPERL